jgi:Ca2+-binding RTX toxin-like protein
MVVLGACGASTVAPATSLAATVSESGNNVQYVAAPGEVNNVTVDQNATGDVYTFTDIVPLTPVSPCTSAGPTSVTCPAGPASGIDHLQLDAGDMNDTVTVNITPPSGTRIGGGPGDDTITGSPGPDVITGGPGDDVIDGNTVSNVDMTVCDTDPFNWDTIGIPNCPDIIDGEAGFNTLRFQHQPGGVIVDAGPRAKQTESVFDPHRSPGPAADCSPDPTATGTCPQSDLLVTKLRRVPKIIGTPANDKIFGSIRNDTLVGGGGADLLCGGFGNDTVDYSGSDGPVNVSLDTNLPPDSKWTSTDQQVRSFSRGDCRQTDSQGNIVPGAQPDCIANDGGASDGPPGARDCVGVDVENIIGGQYDDTLTGSSPGEFIAVAAFFEPRGMNILDGGPGNDTLDGLGGADVLIGGEGQHDTVSYADRQESVAVSLDRAANDGGAADLNPDSGLGDSVGTDVENIIGGSGSDTLAGSDAANVIEGGPGDDIIQGGGGDDPLLDGGDGNDFIQGQAGNDNLQGDAGNDVLDGGTGQDTFSGGSGKDAVDYSNNTTSVVSIPDGVANDGNNGGAEGDNVGADVEDVFGGSGNDTLVPGPEGGVVDGGAGNDTLVSGPGPDLIVGGDGIDNASYAGRSDPVAVDLASGTGGAAGEGDQLAGIEQVTGGNGNDTILGNDAVNILDGGPGNDTVDGRGGDDEIFGGVGNDTLIGGPGNDTLSGDPGDDNLQGGDGADSLNGGDGTDQLDGGPGADSLAGGPGDDTAVYSSRSKAVSVSTDGADNDGEANERDQVRLSVESVKTGAGNDTINVRDGVTGKVSCGAGRDSVVSDQSDTVASDCELKNALSSLATCTITSDPTRMSRRGTIRVRVRCPAGGKATLSLRTVGRAKKAKKLGSKRFTLKAGKRKTVRIKLSGRARRLVKKKKTLRAHATVLVKGAVASSRVKAKRSENLTIVAPKGRKR